MSRKKLKLYVWEGDGVLQDHTPGMVCVLAHDWWEALTLIQQQCSYCLQNMPVLDCKVVELDHPEAFICFGGG